MSPSKIQLTGLGLILGITLGLGGCSDNGSPDAADTLLSLVPRDTPYVFLVDKKAPEALSERMIRATAQSLNQSIDEIPTQGLDADARRLAGLARAIQAELKDKMTLDGLRSVGIEPNGRFVAYGLGVLPVIRLQSNDPKQAEALLARIEKRSGMQAEQRKHGDIAYRYFPFGKLSGVLALHGGYLIAALLPAGGEEQLLPEIFGESRPEHPLAPADFEQFRQAHGFHGYGDGYLDLTRMLALSQGEATGITAEAMKALHPDSAPTKPSPACATFYRGLVASVPRLSFGIARASDTAYSTEIILDTAPGIATILQGIPASVPDLDADGKALLSARLGVNIPRLRDALNDLFRTFLEKGRECESVDQAAITKAMQSLGLLLSPGISGIHGLALAVNDVQLDAQTHQPIGIDAEALLAADDPRGLFSLVALVSPALAKLQVPSDGSPVALPLRDVAPMAPPTWVAMDDHALALAVSAQKPTQLTAVLKSPPSDKAPFFAARFQFDRMMEIAAPLLDAALQQAKGEDADELRQIRDSMKQSAELYKSASFQIKADQRGLVIHTDAEFK